MTSGRTGWRAEVNPHCEVYMLYDKGSTSMQLQIRRDEYGVEDRQTISIDLAHFSGLKRFVETLSRYIDP